MNLGTGDIIGLFPSGTSSITGIQPVMKGRLISTENFSSIIKFENNHDIKNVLDYWGFILEQNFENRKIGISIKSFTDKTIENNIREELTGLSLVAQEEINPDLS